MSKLVEMSLLAHEVAIANGTLTPTERPEFMHLRMTMIDEIPVFDEKRMTADQVWETWDRLEQLVGRRRASNVASAVENFMAAYGRFGLRLRDVMDHVGASKPIVLKALRSLVSDGKARINEESTRGHTGSKRKLYVWLGNALDHTVAEEDADGLRMVTDNRAERNGDTGIRYHGTAVQGLTCGCLGCTDAVEAGFTGEAVSAARERGETGLAEGVDLVTIRRRREEQAWQRAFTAAAG